jgi:hypothetical protein
MLYFILRLGSVSVDVSKIYESVRSGELFNFMKVLFWEKKLGRKAVVSLTSDGARQILLTTTHPYKNNAKTYMDEG